MAQRIGWLIIFAALFASMSQKACAQADLSETKILLLYSYNPTFPTSKNVLAGIEEAFSESLPVIDVEYMDSKRRYDEKNQKLFFDLLNYKLSYLPAYDLIIVVDDNAFNFSLQHQHTLFSNTPIIFLGVNNVAKALEMDNNDKVSGVIEAISIDETLTLIETLRPKSTSLTVIVDDTVSGQSDLKSLNKVLLDKPNVSARIVNVSNYSWQKLPRVLRGIRADENVLLLSAYVDKNKVGLSFNDSFELLTANISVPIFHFWQHGLGKGVAGGVVISHFEQGLTAGSLAKQVLNGKPIEDIKVVASSPNITVVDQGELRRFSINTENIPNTSQMINPQSTLFSSYGKQLLAILFIGALLSVIIIVLFIQNRIRTQLSRSLRKSERTMRTVLDNLTASIYMKDTMGQYVFVNRPLQRNFATKSSDIIGKTASHFMSLERANVINDMDNTVFLNRKKHVTEFVIPKTDNHQQRHIRTTRVPLINDQGELYGLCGIDLDITTQKAQEQNLRRLAHYDPLTGLINRVLFLEKLQKKMDNLCQAKHRIMILYLDLDNFKLINDSYGHDVGDRFIRHIADTLQSQVAEQGLVSRFGGDEFVVIIEQSHAGTAESLINLLLEAIAKPISVNGFQLSSSASIGISEYTKSQVNTPEQLIRQADQAMYDAKKRGGNCASRFDAQRDLSESKRERMIACLKTALSEQQFCLYYQPKVDLFTGKVFGFEALIRWQHPERGLLAPIEFLPFVENNGLIEKIDRWVIDEVLRQSQYWQSQGFNYTVSVNVSHQFFEQPDFATILGQALQKYPELPRGVLDVEVLESVEVGNFVNAAKKIKAAQKLGISFSLDDFGTGFSSLTYLRNLPIQTLKVDRSFVSNMLEQIEDRKILRGIIAITRSFGIRALAEGIETVEQGTMLRNMGYRYGQGYAIARPLPAEQVLAWLQDWQAPVQWQTRATSKNDKLTQVLQPITK